MGKYLYLFIILILLNSIKVHAQNEFYIVAKINDVIMTNYDIKKEATYLKLLNPNLSQLKEGKIIEIAKNSLINEIIKRNELKKIFKFNNEIDVLNKIFKDFYTNLNFSSEKDFEIALKGGNNYSINEIKEKLKIEFFWNRLIFDMFNSQVKINEKELINKIKNSSNFKNQYLLSEIFFAIDKNQSIEERINQINALYDEGNKIIFNTARGFETGIDWSDLTKSQLENWGVKYHSLHFSKPAADYYIDDKNIDLYDWFINE